jgi:YidC/Oxa1 family membrane protein insertase
MITATIPTMVGNSITHSIGQIFQPVFKLFATVLAFIYAVIPNYAIAITILTILIMGALTPLTVKSTKSMIAMQKLQPEIKKLQQKYKGAENRAQMNEELMRLYKEEGVSPAGGCLPMFIQFPFLIILYDIIRGLTNVTKENLPVPQACHLAIQTTHVAPRYIPNTSKMYCNLVASSGKMMSFGIDLALKPFSHHSSWFAAIPFFALVGIAVVLQYVQMSRMNKRNSANQTNSQMQTLQKFMPIIFAYIYFLIPAAVLIYMVVSSIIRIVTQEAIFRSLETTSARSGAKASPRITEGTKKSKEANDKPLPPNGTSPKGQTSPNSEGASGAPKPSANPSTRSKAKRKRKDR